MAKPSKTGSLFHQARLSLESKYAFGQSKFEAKKTGDYVNWIYSQRTALNYLQVAGEFTKWVKKSILNQKS